MENELEIAHLIKKNGRKIVAQYLGANQDKLPEEILLSWQNFEDLSRILEGQEKDFLVEIEKKSEARNRRSLSLCKLTIIALLLLSVIRLLYGAPLIEYLTDKSSSSTELKDERERSQNLE
ncbi:MAG: hypothetical protein QNJ60_00290 [Xenococcaceae cyanobacterium MO_188.B19]|nr:hypothetical protein [Xenococcaceae cyanobacterium MO_188.B19]